MFKVGELVRVRTGLKESERYGGVTWLYGMKECEGKVFTVDSITFDSLYTLSSAVGFFHGWVFSEEMLEDPLQNAKVSDIFLSQTKENEADMVNHPPHYTFAGLEAIEVIDAFFKENYYLGQVFKYIARAGKKGDEIEDLKKAQWYLIKYIEMKEGK